MGSMDRRDCPLRRIVRSRLVLLFQESRKLCEELSPLWCAGHYSLRRSNNDDRSDFFKSVFCHCVRGTNPVHSYAHSRHGRFCDDSFSCTLSVGRTKRSIGIFLHCSKGCAAFHQVKFEVARILLRQLYPTTQRIPQVRTLQGRHLPSVNRERDERILLTQS